jgi:acyl carrier protein
MFEVKAMLDDVLNLDGRASRFTKETFLLGSVPELDSMAVISLISAIEERFQCTVEDEEIDGAIFETLGSLMNFVKTKTEVLSH